MLYQYQPRGDVSSFPFKIALLTIHIPPQQDLRYGKDFLTYFRNFQTRTVLIVKFLREGELVVGKMMLVNGEVKRNMGGRTETVMICRTECDRIQALQEHFGITLTLNEKEGVRGRNVDLDV